MKYRMLVVAVAAVAVSANAHVVWQIGQKDGGCRVEPIYEIASPLYEKAVIDLGRRFGRGDTFTIVAHGASRRNKYVQRAVLNGKPLDTFTFPAKEVLNGGSLELWMGAEPNRNWGL